MGLLLDMPLYNTKGITSVIICYVICLSYYVYIIRYLSDLFSRVVWCNKEPNKHSSIQTFVFIMNLIFNISLIFIIIHHLPALVPSYLGSTQHVMFSRSLLFAVMASSTPFSNISCVTQSIHLFFGLPLLLHLSTFIPIT